MPRLRRRRRCPRRRSPTKRPPRRTSASVDFLGPLAPSLALLGASLAIFPQLDHRRNWARHAIVALTFAIVARYMWWRVEATVLPADPATLGGVWIWFCFIIEALVLGDLVITFMIL